MYYKNWNETMVGDGYTVACHCPNTSEDRGEDKEPDANPVYCDSVER